MSDKETLIKDNLIMGPWKTMREYDMQAQDKRGVFFTMEEYKTMIKQAQLATLERLERMIMYEATMCEQHMQDQEYDAAHARLINMLGIFERLKKEEPAKKPEDKEEA